MYYIKLYWVKVPRAQAHRAVQRVHRWWIEGNLSIGEGLSGNDKESLPVNHGHVVDNVFGERHTSYTLKTSFVDFEKE